MAGFDYVGSGAPTFSGPAAAPAQYFDKAGRVCYVWDGLSGRWIPGPGTNSTVDNITALGTNQGNATVIAGTPTAINVTTVAAGTGILLFPSWTGAEIAINNLGANALLIYPNGTETIDSGGAGVALSAAINTVTVLFCFTQGKWYHK